MKRETLEFISNILVGVCVGIIIDYFAKTSFVFSLAGLVVGVILAMVLRNRKGK
ncbi:MAG: AtpZ/AtpI family protein [Aristaeellaceae bacterium]